jgi:hypothetical protein
VSIRASASHRRGTPPGQSVYRLSFVREVHRLLAAGYTRLRKPATLASKEETEITGILVEGMRDAIEGPKRLAWASRYAVHDDRPISQGNRQGRTRARIDIEVERTMPGPHPRFQFEAKRLHRGDSVSEYVGAKGLGAFLDRTYAASCAAAGMIAYVQTTSMSSWAKKIETKLGSDRATHLLAEGAKVWKKASLCDVKKLTSYQSSHARTPTSLDVFHTFLRCY